MNKKIRKVFAAFASALTLSALLAQASPAVFAQEEEKPQAPEFESTVTHEGEKIEGGTLNYALVSDTAFAGVLNNMLYSGQPDSEVINFFNPGLFGYDENFQYDDEGFGQVELDQENKQVTITIPEGEKWDDGEDITIDDVIFPYYVIGHPDYTGIRYGVDFENVEGMEEYHNGEADEISGLERVDDYTLKVTYKEFPNSMIQAGGGISHYIEPEHVLSEIPVAELEDSEAVRTKPVGFGPFKVESITPGESVTFAVNEYYYKDRPAVDKVQLKVVNPTSIVAELKAGNIDIAQLASSEYETFADASNFSVIGRITNSYSYIGFKMGKWDAEKEEVVYDPELATSNKALRQAMAKALDLPAVSENFYYGIQQQAQSHITPNFTEYISDEVKGYEYDPEGAKKLLADAGFEDKDGDGFVEDPKGQPLTLNYATMSGNSTNESIAQYYIQAWNAIGLNVQLLDGQLIEFNSFYERIQNDDPEVHVYGAAWGMGGDPNPTNLYGPEAEFNFPRWQTEEHNEILDRLNSDDSFDDEFRAQAYADWQKMMMDELPTYPTFWQYDLFAVNKRVSTYDVAIGNDLQWSDIYLTSEQPVKE
ncbi:oligopeptide ABC transporter substrate-binding protein [Facklamia sp. DSM 111018]|uniref:Oligopeptide ABC transporter substrate-binding protein n=1 Tax=Facklamia lactis TaxID=2749967 RepID=A0ABS0LN22_9LACT|nr:oligopeptide ABC transporter substrate-binding protein [Facklamia lactis]MBG9979812.1 oligopeptide ABC transporter substrate-binding protein [Facklamia lactis]MBG9985508.1 oligopeptide ABC transporter substrate-binding protein [Facklamia lactis]